MENPYARAAAAPAPATPEQQRVADYEAAIGKNTGYYLKYFEAFDAGESKATWHWPAFFVTSFWFLYRKMWLPGLANLAWPFVVSNVLFIVFAIVRPSVPVMVIVSAALLVAPWILFPIYANAIYWRHIRKLIDGLPKSIATVPDKRQARLERNGGTGAGALVIIAVVGGFFLVGIIGILAAIAIPAYQDYTIRSQVSEGLLLASPVKAAVAEYYAGHQAWPEQADFGTETPSGMYVKSVSVASGSVVITYGNRANPRLNGQRLALQPGVSSQGDIIWACGNATLPEGVKPAGGPSGTDLAPKYLPKACRADQP